MKGMNDVGRKRRETCTCASLASPFSRTPCPQFQQLGGHPFLHMHYTPQTRRVKHLIPRLSLCLCLLHPPSYWHGQVISEWVENVWCPHLLTVLSWPRIYWQCSSPPHPAKLIQEPSVLWNALQLSHVELRITSSVSYGTLFFGHFLCASLLSPALSTCFPPMEIIGYFRAEWILTRFLPSLLNRWAPCTKEIWIRICWFSRC